MIQVGLLEKSGFRKPVPYFLIMGMAALLILTFLSPGSASESKPPIKIGVLYPLVGLHAYLGKAQVEGVKLFFEKKGYKIADRDIQLIIEDTEGNPDTGLMKARKLIEKDKVHILLGIVVSSVAYAVRDTVHSSQTPLLITMANAAGMTRDRRSPYIFRSYQADGTAMYYASQYVYEKMRSRKAIFSGPDYAYGHENAEAFRKGFQKSGGEVLKEIFVPLGTKDFGPYLTLISQFGGKADTLAFVYGGSDSIKFVKGLDEYRVKDKFRVLINLGATSPGTQLKEEGKAALGIYSIDMVYSNLNSPVTKEFLALVKQKYGYYDFNHHWGYLGAEVVGRALEQIQGNIEQKNRFLEALRKVRFESINGPFEFDQQGQNAIVNFYILRNEMVGGQVDQMLVDVLPKKRDPWWLNQQW